jgi:hypothetical protein
MRQRHIPSRTKNLNYLAPLADRSHWAEQEWETVHLGDQRLHKRLFKIATQLAQSPNASLPQACGPGKAIKAAYRFFENDYISAEELLQAHRHSTIQRLQAQPVVLIPQDTTSFNYTDHPQTKGTGPIGDTVAGPQGLLLHSALALTENGEPLGVLLAKVWARDPEDLHKAQKRHEKSLAEKESVKWLEGWRVIEAAAKETPQTLVIGISDREGDVYEILAEAHKTSGPNLGMLVRLRHDRKVASPQEHLFAHLAAEPARGKLTIQVPRHEQQRARVAKLEIRFGPVTIQPPQRVAELAPIQVWVVEAREVHPPAGVDPICWRLLSTRPVPTVAAAIQCIQWYAKRWQIEVFHKVLKSGCRMEKRQFKTDQRLERLLMLYLVIAWRVMALTLAGRAHPDWPATLWLERDEWQSLYCWANAKAVPARQVPRLRQCVLWIGQLGGFMGRKCDGYPGPMCIWRGLQRLKDIVIGYTLSKYAQ